MDLARFDEPVLDHGRVKCVNFYGGDLSVVNGARASFGKEKTEVDDKDRKLIGFLMKNRHGTPFEHASFTFLVQAPIFVAREWFRHRWSSFNEYSLRYAEAKEDVYVPKPAQVRSQTGKLGAYTYTALPSDVDIEDSILAIKTAYSSSIEAYKSLLEKGVAKELARIVLPVGLYTSFYWTVNARSFMNFLSLRNHEAAMWEIREYAKVLEQMFSQLMPITHGAFVEVGRVAP